MLQKTCYLPVKFCTVQSFATETCIPVFYTHDLISNTVNIIQYHSSECPLEVPSRLSLLGTSGKYRKKNLPGEIFKTNP